MPPPKNIIKKFEWLVKKQSQGLIIQQQNQHFLLQRQHAQHLQVVVDQKDEKQNQQPLPDPQANVVVQVQAQGILDPLAQQVNPAAQVPDEKQDAAAPDPLAQQVNVVAQVPDEKQDAAAPDPLAQQIVQDNQGDEKEEKHEDPQAQQQPELRAAAAVVHDPADAVLIDDDGEEKFDLSPEEVEAFDIFGEIVYARNLKKMFKKKHQWAVYKTYAEGGLEGSNMHLKDEYKLSFGDVVPDGVSVEDLVTDSARIIFFQESYEEDYLENWTEMKELQAEWEPEHILIDLFREIPEDDDSLLTSMKEDMPRNMQKYIKKPSDRGKDLKKLREESEEFYEMRMTDAVVRLGTLTAKMKDLEDIDLKHLQVSVDTAMLWIRQSRKARRELGVL